MTAPEVRKELLESKMATEKRCEPNQEPPGDAIESLYLELQRLLPQAKNNPILKARIAQRFSRLRRLQREEAAAMGKYFADTLRLPLGAGLSLMAEARRVVENEDPSAG